MSDSVRSHRRQPTRLPRPWDSPGKNTGAGCHFLLQCMKVKSEREVAQSCPTLSDPVDCCLPGPWDFPGRSTGVGCHCLLQCMKEKSEREVAQSCLTLSDRMDHSPPGSSIHGIFQAGVLERGAIAFSTNVKRMMLILQCCHILRKRRHFSHLLTSDISCTSRRGMLTVVMSWVQQTLRMFRSPIMAGSRAVMFPDFTLSSTQRWKATCISERLECRVM